METILVVRGPEDFLVPSGEIHWQSPPTGTYKSNWDVAIDSKNDKLGFGCIMRDFSGNGACCFLLFNGCFG
jgi:hypothetical protein